VSGNLNLTTVGVSRGGLSLVQAVRGWFDDKVAVVPEESVYPPGRSEQQTQKANREAFLTSEQAAETVALAHLGYPVKVVVQDVPKGSPSDPVLVPGDSIDAIDGRPTPDSATLQQVLTDIPGGTTVTVARTHLGQSGQVQISTRAAKDRTGSLLGVSVLEQPSAPFDVRINVADVGGPSAGLMLTLGILDLVGKDDLTRGAVVAGTGTIDAKGAVGPIGGITLKMVAAKDIGAQLFLVPADNCTEATGVADPGFPLARVANLDDALKALSDFEAGRTPARC
jgi:PDZ domain-containing protein